MSVTRAWFTYLGGAGGVQNAVNYSYLSIPPSCADGTPNICGIFGVYQPATYGDHPKPFGPKLTSYINLAVGLSAQQPSGSAKRYVYVRPTNP